MTEIPVKVLTESLLNEHTHDLYLWINKFIQHLAEMKQMKTVMDEKQIELEFVLRPVVPLDSSKGRRGDIGNIMYLKWKEFLVDYVREIQDKEDSNRSFKKPKETSDSSGLVLSSGSSVSTASITPSLYEYDESFDYFYMDGLTRQRSWLDTNRAPEWRRKLPVLEHIKALEYVYQDFQIVLKTKYEKLVDQLPKEALALWIRHKKTHRFAIPEHRGCFVFLSEVQNFEPEKHSHTPTPRYEKVGPPVYEFEIEMEPQFLESLQTAQQTSWDKATCIYEYRNQQYKPQPWKICGNIIQQMHELLGI